MTSQTIVGVTLVGIIGLLCGRLTNLAAAWFTSVPRPRFFLIEAVVAGLFIALYLEKSLSPPGLLLAALAIGLVMLSTVDLLAGFIPDAILVILAPLGMIYVYASGLGGIGDVVASVIAGALAGATALAIRCAYKRLRGQHGLGLGDVKLFAVAGLWLGPSGLPALMIVSGLAGVAFALLWRRLGGSPEFPFGPALSLGMFLCLLFPALTRVFG